MAQIKKYGIDISSWQGNINLTPYKNGFVIIRGGFDITTDNKAKRNMDECERLGIPYGIYWYSYALNTAQAEAEARACLNLIKGRNIKVGVWFDMEDADGYKRKRGFSFNKLTITALCRAFCNVIAKAGYYTGIYASKSWLDSYIDAPEYDKWVAWWGSNDGTVQVDGSKYGTMLQYTSTPLDKNVTYVDLSHYQGKVKPQPVPKEELIMDGIIGYYSVEYLQKWLGTFIDGEIWGQVKAQAKWYPNITSVTFGGGGSACIRQLQKYLKSKNFNIGASGEDGILGRDTIKALQQFLNKKYSLKLATDGVCGPETAKALQRHLNKVVTA